MQDAIKITDLSFSYNDESQVLDKLSLNIKKGSYCVILGQNGSGKSTLAKLIMGLLEANEGNIVVNGLEVNVENIYEIRKQAGIVFQNPDNQFIGATVRDDIAFGLENRQVPQKEMDSIIATYASKTGMDKYLDKEPSNLSGGQKQRVAIAGVLAMRPNILIFDEATSMLDPKGKREIKEIIVRLKKEIKDVTVLSITHDIEEALLADEIIVLNKGKIVEQGSPKEVFKHAEKLPSYGLDIPFAYKLINKLKELGIDPKTIDIEKMVELNGN